MGRGNATDQEGRRVAGDRDTKECATQPEVIEFSFSQDRIQPRLEEERERPQFDIKIYKVSEGGRGRS